MPAPRAEAPSCWSRWDPARPSPTCSWHTESDAYAPWSASAPSAEPAWRLYEPPQLRSSPGDSLAFALTVRGPALAELSLTGLPESARRAAGSPGVPDELRGEELIVVAHAAEVRELTPRVAVRYRAPRELPAELRQALPAGSRRALETAAARRLIAALLRRLEVEDDPVLAQEVRRLALEHGLVTFWTALLLVDASGSSS